MVDVLKVINRLRNTAGARVRFGVKEVGACQYRDADCLLCARFYIGALDIGNLRLRDPHHLVLDAKGIESFFRFC